MASIDSGLTRAFRMDDATWARHANPLSVWTRLPVLPVLICAIWSRQWLGWWCLAPVGLMLLWTWWNPRAFSRPVSTDNWASKAVLGERVWLNRKEAPIPAHHGRAAMILSVVAGVGMPPLIWGLVELHMWATVLGLAIVLLSKLWFLDRMVWLFDDMIDTDPRFREWLY